MYYDTLNARDFTPGQQGYDVATVNPVSNDFGLTWALGDPKNGILPLANPFPARADGTRYASTSFGQVRAVSNNVMRFLTFNGTFRF